jgi:sodium-dependent phosphate cotransporter
LAGYFARLFEGSGDASIRDFNVIRQITRPVISEIRDVIRMLPDEINGFVMILVGIAAVLLAVYLLNTMLRKAMTGRAQRLFNAAVGKSAALAVLAGLIVTILVQSSTLTTVLIVPMAGAGLFTLAQVYPFTLGANIGTPITAVLSATAVTGEYQVFALQVALVHLFYNGIGVALFAAIPPLWRLPMRAAQALADGAARSRWVVPAYILGAFFVLPGLAFTAQSVLNNKSAAVIQAETNKDVYDAAKKESEEKEVEIE